MGHTTVIAFADITDHHEVLYFVWWAFMLILAGYLTGRLLSTLQRFATGVINASASYPRWHVTIIQAVMWIVTVAMWLIIFITIANRAGLPSSFISSLGALLGAGIGFGCQYIFRDIINGAIHLTEKMFIVGDYIALDAGGTHYEGTVEEISLRHITISTLSSVVHIPQGSIDMVENYSSGPGRIDITIPISPNDDISTANSVIDRSVHDIMRGHPPTRHAVLSHDDMDALTAIISLSSLGVSDVSKGFVSMKVTGMTKPGVGFAAKRSCVKIMVAQLKAHGIDVSSVPRVAVK